MSANTRFIAIATGGLLIAAVLSYFLLKTPDVPTSADIPQLLQQIPATDATDPSALSAWPEKRALGRYDNMARAGNLMLGRWANNIKDACIAAVPITSIPDENAWQQPVDVMQCFDGAMVLVINLKD